MFLCFELILFLQNKIDKFSTLVVPNGEFGGGGGTRAGVKYIQKYLNTIQILFPKIQKYINT